MLAVDPDADEALAAGAVEDPVALGLAVLDERAEDEQPRALGQREDLVDDLLDRLALDRVAVGAVRDADPGEQQPQVVVDLGDRADRRARVARRALLVDRDGRRQAVDLVDVRLLHLAQELAGVGAQALDVAALALGVDRVEGEAGLAAARQAGDDDQPVTRERDVDVLEVVFARAAHDEPILGHGSSVPDRQRARRTGASLIRADRAVDDLSAGGPGAGPSASGCSGVTVRSQVGRSSQRACQPASSSCSSRIPGSQSATVFSSMPGSPGTPSRLSAGSSSAGRTVTLVTSIAGPGGDRAAAPRRPRARSAAPVSPRPFDGPRAARSAARPTVIDASSWRTRRRICWISSRSAAARSNSSCLAAAFISASIRATSASTLARSASLNSPVRSEA